MNMIWHYNSDPKVELDPVVVQAAFEHDGTHTLRKSPPVIGTKCYEVLLVVALKMRKLSTIKSLRHSRLYVGTAALGCPRSEAPQS